MARWLFTPLALVVALSPAPADDPKAVVERAIQAHGGRDLLTKFKAGTGKYKGRMVLFGTESDVTGAFAFQAPDKYRMRLDLTLNGMSLTVVQTLNGTAVTSKVNGTDSPLTDKLTAELRQAAVQQEMTQLVPLLDAARFTLTAKPDVDVGGKPAAVVGVTPKGGKEVSLSFDKASGRLVKISRRALAPSQGNDPTEVLEETLLADYKPVDGVQVPMRMTVSHDGKPFVMLNVTEAKNLAALPPGALEGD
jgi:hypothetical protein